MANLAMILGAAKRIKPGTSSRLAPGTPGMIGAGTSPATPSLQRVGQAASAGGAPGGVIPAPVDPNSGATDDTTDPNAAYLSEFSSGLGEARSAIQNQMSAALSEISQREALANQALGNMPADLNNIYAPAQAQVANTAQALYTAQQNSGMTPLLPEGAEAAPIQASLAGALASRQADVPYLQQAAAGSFSKQRADVQSNGGSQLADIATQEAQMRDADAKDARDFAAQQASAKSDRSNAVEDQAASFEHDKEMANLNAKLSGQKAQKTTTWGRFEVDPQRGGMIAEDRPDLANHIRHGNDKPSKVYRSIVKNMTQNPPKDATDLLNRVTKIKKKHHSLPRSVSLALFDAGISGQ